MAAHLSNVSLIVYQCYKTYRVNTLKISSFTVALLLP